MGDKGNATNSRNDASGSNSCVQGELLLEIHSMLKTVLEKVSNGNQRDRPLDGDDSKYMVSVCLQGLMRGAS